MDGKMHLKLAGIGAASLFFDTLDGLVMTFVLSRRFGYTGTRDHAAI